MRLTDDANSRPTNLWALRLGGYAIENEIVTAMQMNKRIRLIREAAPYCSVPNASLHLAIFARIVSASLVQVNIFGFAL